MIYIDPPYNTGNDTFIYPDRFSETREAYFERIGDKDEAGYMTREGLFHKNSKDSGHYHSNFKIWQGDTIENGLQLEKQMQLHLDSVKKDAVEENMLFELLLKSGRSLNSAIENTGDYYRINDKEMVIALTKIDEKIVDAILKDKPQVFITLDRLFENNDQLKTNTLLQMKDASIEFKVV